MHVHDVGGRSQKKAVLMSANMLADECCKAPLHAWCTAEYLEASGEAPERLTDLYLPSWTTLQTWL